MHMLIEIAGFMLAVAAILFGICKLPTQEEIESECGV